MLGAGRWGTALLFLAVVTGAGGRSDTFAPGALSAMVGADAGAEVATLADVETFFATGSPLLEL